MIRVDKIQVGARRFGSSVIIKDNLIFGIKEDASNAKEKVEGDDELYNLETKKAGNLNCEFWLEFENSVRMHINMLDKVEPNKDLIPVQAPLNLKEVAPKSSAGRGASIGESAEPGETMDRESVLSKESNQKPKSSMKSQRQSYDDKPPVSKGSVDDHPEAEEGEEENKIADK